MKVIGLSLSRCIPDIASGKVAEGDVEYIITGASFKTKQEFELVLAEYAKLDWRYCTPATQIARRLYVAGKIRQPELRPSPAYGHWIIT